MPREAFGALCTNAYASLKQMRIERIDGSFHFVMIDQPELVLARVDAFLAGRDGLPLEKAGALH